MAVLVRGLVVLIVAVVLSSCGGNSNPTAPAPTPTPTPTPAPTSPHSGTDWFSLDAIEPARGATIRPGEGQWLQIMWSHCQADPAQIWSIAFIRDDGADFASYFDSDYRACTNHAQGGWKTDRSSPLMKWASGHRVNADLMIGRRPLSGVMDRDGEGHVVWANVVKRYHIPLDWYVEPAH